jgi:hypothetical protein
MPYIIRNSRKIALAYPETTPLDNIEESGYITRHMYMGCIPDKVSADGKYIYGRLMNSNNMWFAAKWTRVGDSNEYTFKELGQYEDGDMNVWEKVFTEQDGKTYLIIQPIAFLRPQNVTGLSQNGRYACGFHGNSLTGGGQLFRYDMEAEQLQMLSAEGTAMHITDDGTLFDDIGNVHLLDSNTPIRVKEWITRTYGAGIAEEVVTASPYLLVNYVSTDYTTAILYSIDQYETKSYIITVEP